MVVTEDLTSTWMNMWVLCIQDCQNYFWVTYGALKFTLSTAQLLRRVLFSSSAMGDFKEPPK